MDPALLAELAEKNPQDLEAVVTTIGLQTLIKMLPLAIKLAPNLQRLAATAAAYQARQPKT
jgi:hypothetical protein